MDKEPRRLPVIRARDEAEAVQKSDVERALRFNHVIEMQTKQQLSELTARFNALFELLVARGLLPLQDYEERCRTTHEREAVRVRGDALVVVDGEQDKYALSDLPQVDCEARLHLCKGRCCTLVFPLSFQDLDERVVQWDYSRPYQIAQRPDGYCVHSDEQARSCQVYAQRPAICRTYSCREDKRIWVDFDKRIPAP